MSWDIFIQDLPDVASINDVPSTYRPKPIGDRATIVARIKEAVPFAEEQDKDWLFVRQPGYDISLQLHMENADTVRYVVAHVHGGDQSAVCVAAIVKALGLRAHDTETGELFDGSSLDESL
ncbi:MAG: hypothetical protein E6Q44_06550 [Flavobacteriales bacterium]|jgi:hypothetical protein|nr:MAG: hypothetical protein E6Q44_06550 [Flavobacteriales bacterium]